MWRAEINDWTKGLTINQVDGLMIEHSIPAGKVYRAPEMLADPHFQARDAIIELETERFGPIKMQNAFPRLSDTPSSVRSPAPSTVGQHNAEVYGRLLNLNDDDLAALKASGTI
jgi:formyl-CoA transferase